MGLDLGAVDIALPLKGWQHNGLRFVLGKPKSQAPVFPEPWAGIISTQQARCTTVWTYWQLPLDLGPAPSAARNRLFQNMITALNWPREHLVFWPLCTAEEGTLKARTELFWQGVRRFNPLYLICFGNQAFDLIAPGNSREFGLFKTGQIDYVFLPGPEDMLPDNKQAKRIVWNTLRQLPGLSGQHPPGD